MSVLQKKYREELKPKLHEKFKYSHAATIPAVKKIILNVGAGEAARDKNVLQDCIRELAVITGQKPIVTKAKKSISNFKLREGQAIGVKVTLRGKRMYDFMYRFFNIVCPRIRDFRGFERKCDGSGNYTLGIEDQQVFPEINLDEVKRVMGMNITFVTSAKSDEECVELLSLLGLPFKRTST